MLHENGHKKRFQASSIYGPYMHAYVCNSFGKLLYSYMECANGKDTREKELIKNLKT